MQMLIVVVRYNVALDEAETIAGLSRAFAEHPELGERIGTLIWDNSPSALENPQLSFPFEYRHSSKNFGVSGAYNGAIEIANAQGCPWLLLLDQDTRVTAAFLKSMLAHSNELESNAQIAAVAPTVMVRHFVVSPRQQLFNRHRAYAAGESGVAPGEAFAINSGCLMRVAALREIGGFSDEFWLDYSDMYVFHQFFLHRKKVWRAAEVTLEHEMSVMDYDRLMTPWRYRNFSAAESAFNDLYKGALENGVQNLRLLARALKQRRKYKNPEFSRIAWDQLRYRLTTTRNQRLATWRAAAAERFGDKPESST